MYAQTTAIWSEAQSKAIQTELDRILRSPLFARAERQRRFLQFIVAETLAGRADRISGYTVATGAYDREQGFEPMLDPIVRVEAQRLRAKLREYYDGDGRTRSDPYRFGQGLLRCDDPRGRARPCCGVKPCAKSSGGEHG